VWLAKTFGYSPVFVAGGLAALAGLVAIPGLPGRASLPGRTVGVLGALRNTSLLGPLVVFFVVAMAAGIVVTFVPLVVPGASGNLAAAALLVQAAAATLFRWWAGRLGDRRGPASLLVPAVVASAVGVLALAFAADPAVVLAGMAILGAGWGVSQNATLALMLDRVAPSGYGAASALWYVAYDAGLGLGAAGFGVVATSTGYPAAFALTAALLLVAIFPARRDPETDRKP
jgi:predicted MFS family arabinose efflux permease